MGIALDSSCDGVATLEVGRALGEIVTAGVLSGFAFGVASGVGVGLAVGVGAINGARVGTGVGFLSGAGVLLGRAVELLRSKAISALRGPEDFG